MERYIILLRGINVGGKNLVPMKKLVPLLEEQGYLNVKTYIQSGNIILDGKNLTADSVATLISTKFGFMPKVVILSAEEFASAIKNNPFNPEGDKFAHFYFCEQEPKLDKQKLNTYKSESEETRLIGNIFYLHAPDGIGRSKLVANIEACLGVAATGRNLNTIDKIASMVTVPKHIEKNTYHVELAQI